MYDVTHPDSVDNSRQRFRYETQARHWGEIESCLKDVEDWSSSVECGVDVFT